MQIKESDVSCLHCYGQRISQVVFGDTVWEEIALSYSQQLPILCAAAGFVNEDTVPGRGHAPLGQKATTW